MICQIIMNIRQESLRASLGIPYPYRVRATTKVTKLHKVSDRCDLSDSEEMLNEPRRGSTVRPEAAC